jgi:polyisoprenoid-binding protein YceI
MLLRLASALLLVPALLSAQGPATATVQQGTAAPGGASTTWTIDKTHSELTFVIRHLVSRVRGTFRDWKGTITMADAARWETATIDVAIQTASIFTDNERRDAHLRTSDFFLADSFPVISFRSTRIERDGEKARIHGALTMRGITRAVVLEGRFLGLQKLTNGAERLGFEASTTVNRLDYGVQWNRAVEGGGMTLGDDVTIEIIVAAVRAPARPPAR